jgi:hypothetical protein
MNFPNQRGDGLNRSEIASVVSSRRISSPMRSCAAYRLWCSHKNLLHRPT